MGKPGPKPVPTERMKARGSKQPRLKLAEPEKLTGKPTCPDWLDTEGKRCWNHLVKILEQLGILSRADRNAIARYSAAWSRWRKAVEFVQENGEKYEVTSDNGSFYRPYPEAAVIAKCAAEMHRLDQEFGLTPSAKSRIHLEPPQKADDMLDLIRTHYGAKKN